MKTYENTLPMDDQPVRPTHIDSQTNNNCQQFFGPVKGCIFAMPGSTVNQCNDLPTEPLVQPKESPADKTAHCPIILASCRRETKDIIYSELQYAAGVSASEFIRTLVKYENFVRIQGLTPAELFEIVKTICPDTKLTPKGLYSALYRNRPKY